jgi:hypothetical protein
LDARAELSGTFYTSEELATGDFDSLTIDPAIVVFQHRVGIILRMAAKSGCPASKLNWIESRTD